MIVTRVPREMTRGRMVAGLEKLLSVGRVGGEPIAVVTEDSRAAGDSSMTTVLHGTKLIGLRLVLFLVSLACLK